MRLLEHGTPARGQKRCGGGVWQRCVAGAWQLESPKEDGACFPKATAVDLGVSRVKIAK